MSKLPGLPSTPAVDTRYRECMAEIVAALKKYDMAGAITVVSKERCMFKYHFPTWSVASIEPGPDGTGAGIRLRSKREDFATKEAQKQASELTAHCIMQMRDVAINTLGVTTEIAKVMREKWGMEHEPHADFDPELEH
jgi:hypothetical protein